MRSAAPASQRTSEGFEVFREGLDLLEAVVADPENIVVGPQAFYLDSYGYQGFVHDLVSDYRVLSVVRTRPGAAFFISKPARGTYYPAFIMYDEQGVPDQVVTYFVGNERKGVAVAAAHDNRSYLFVLTEACEFTGNALITLMTPASGGGSYRIENLLLLKDKPRQEPRSHGFSSVRAVPLERAGRRQARITWITDWATRSRLEYGPSADYGSRVETEEVALPPSAATYAQVYMPPVTSIYNNHRIILDDLQADRTYHYRLLGTAPDGTEVRSQDHTFSTAPRRRPRGDVARDAVPLQVANEAPVQRRGWPVTSGVPFPQGALMAAEYTRLLNGSGAEIPLQAAVLAEWPDGSVKWLLIDFQADVAAADSADYRLEFGHDVVRREDRPRTPLALTESGTEVALHTGPLKVLLDGRAPCFPARVWIDANGDGTFSADEEVTDPRSPGLMELTTADGTTFRTHEGVCSVAVEERGPLRTVVKVQGRLQAADARRMFTYVTRLTAYAGKDFVRILHTWENDHVTDNFTAVRSLMLRTPLRLADPSCTLFCADEAAYRSDGRPTLAQLEDDEYTVTDPGGAGQSGGVRWSGGRASGTIDLSDRTRGLTIAVRDFWQNYPKSLGATANGLEVGLCPPLPYDRYCARGELEDKLYYYLQDGAYKLKQGASRTHELVYRFHSGPAPSSPPHLQEPLRARAPAAWYCDSKAFGDVAAVDPGKFPEYEHYADHSLANYLETRETGREYGMLNFGDWYHVQKWGNIEYDTPHVFFLHYARGGDSRFFTAGEQAARHYMDVDTCHHHADHGFVDRVYAHCIGHTGDYYPYYYRKGGAQGVIEMEVDHTWVQGLLDYHLLSGDRRALEIATRIGDKYDQLYTVNFDFCNCRRPGWHLILTMALYQTTGDHFYLNAAELIVQRVRERYTSNGWPHQLLLGHCECLPRCSGNADFMVGVLLSGLKRYHQATGDEAAADLIVGACEFLIREHWIAAEKAFRYTRCPKSGISAARNSLILEGPAYAYRLSGDERFKSAVLNGFSAGLKGSAHAAQPIGKHFGERACVAPHILYDIDTCMR